MINELENDARSSDTFEDLKKVVIKIAETVEENIDLKVEFDNMQEDYNNLVKKIEELETIIKT